MTLIDSKETLNDAKVISTVRSKIEPLLNAGCDRIVLGCTHFPHLKPVIEKVCAGRAEVIDPSDAVARQARRVLARLGLLRGESAAEPSHVFISSKPPDPQMGYGARTADML
jgi:glutamate racemase